MNKFTFRLKDRMKLTVEKVSPRVCLFVVSGKNTYTFRISSKKAKEVVSAFKTVGSIPDIVVRVDLDGNMSTGVLRLHYITDNEYDLLVFCDGGRKILDTTFNKKFLKKMYKTMEEVFEIE